MILKWKKNIYVIEMIGSVVYLHYFMETCMWGYIFTSVIICFMVLWGEKKSMPRIIQINIKALTPLVLQWCGFSKSKKLPQLFGMSRRNNECKCCWWWQSLKFCKWKMTHPFVNSSPLQREPVNAFVSDTGSFGKVRRRLLSSFSVPGKLCPCMVACFLAARMMMMMMIKAI